MSKPKYLLDANVFIEAARRYYAFDLAPGFWDALNSHGQNGSIQTIDRVKDEIIKGKDQLCDWISDSFDPYIVSTDVPEIITNFAEIMSWATSQSYSEAAKAELASVADGWLVACAKHSGSIVVTHEALDKSIKRKIPIPNVCEQFNVPYIDTFGMLRALQVKLGSQ